MFRTTSETFTISRSQLPECVIKFIKLGPTKVKHVKGLRYQYIIAKISLYISKRTVVFYRKYERIAMTIWTSFTSEVGNFFNPCRQMIDRKSFREPDKTETAYILWMFKREVLQYQLKAFYILLKYLWWFSRSRFMNLFLRSLIYLSGRRSWRRWLVDIDETRASLGLWIVAS